MKKKTIFIIKVLFNIVQRWFEWFENEFHFFFRFLFDRIYERVLAWIFSQRNIQTISSVHLIVQNQMQFFWHHKQSSVHSMTLTSSATSRHHSEWRCISNGLLLFQFHREWRCSQLTATDFRHRQSLACIWSFHDRMQQSDNQTTLSVHLIVRNQMQSSDITDNFVSASDRSRSSAVFLTSDNIVSAFNFIAIECSNSGINVLSFDRGEVGCSNVLISDNRQSIWSFHDRMQQFWHHIQSSVHLIISASDAVLTISSKQSSVHLMTSASDAALTIKQFRQCIWWYQHQMQHFWHQN